MLFKWNTKYHGPCLVSALTSAGTASVIITWGKSADGYSVEYRIANLDTDDERQKLDRATRLAMGHFENVDTHQIGLINLEVDSTSRTFDGVIPQPLA